SVLALPGNPVSSLGCFRLFARAYLDACRGRTDPPPYRVRVRARPTHDLRPDAKTEFHRATLTVHKRRATGTPCRDPTTDHPHTPPYRVRVRARLTHDLRPDGKTVFHRATLSVDARGATVTPYRDQSSAVSRSLHESSCLAVAPPGGARAGEVVEVIPFRWP